MNKYIKKIVLHSARILNVSLYKKLPRGIDPFRDIEFLIPSWKADIIFDVGANTGQSALAYSKAFPTSRIFSFEPVPLTFNILKNEVKKYPNISPYNLALSSAKGEGHIIEGDGSDTNRVASFLLSTDRNNIKKTVSISTIDFFCHSNKIEKINYLKIDTEGGDLDVLKGAESMLSSRAIEIIEVEAGVGHDNTLHVPLNNFISYLSSFGYAVFGFYDQMHEWRSSYPHLRRTNIVFILE
jgi:FkbM family methyltransferase